MTFDYGAEIPPSGFVDPQKLRGAIEYIHENLRES
jgi:hypothetical protein